MLPLEPALFKETGELRHVSDRDIDGSLRTRSQRDRLSFHCHPVIRSFGDQTEERETIRGLGSKLIRITVLVLVVFRSGFLDFFQHSVNGWSLLLELVPV